MKIEKIITKQNIYNPIICFNTNCKRLKEYILQKGDPLWASYSREGPAIITGTIAVKIIFGTYPYEKEIYFCRSCVDDVFEIFKQKLDTRLWIFE